jgi:hypothetical protein
MAEPLTPVPAAPAEDRAPRLMARTVHRDLLAQGFTEAQIVTFARHLMALAQEDADPEVA